MHIATGLPNPTHYLCIGQKSLQKILILILIELHLVYLTLGIKTYKWCVLG